MPNRTKRIRRGRVMLPKLLIDVSFTVLCFGLTYTSLMKMKVDALAPVELLGQLPAKIDGEPQLIQPVAGSKQVEPSYSKQNVGKIQVAFQKDQEIYTSKYINPAKDSNGHSCQIKNKTNNEQNKMSGYVVPPSHLGTSTREGAGETKVVDERVVFRKPIFGIPRANHFQRPKNLTEIFANDIKGLCSLVPASTCKGGDQAVKRRNYTPDLRVPLGKSLKDFSTRVHNSRCRFLLQ